MRHLDSPEWHSRVSRRSAARSVLVASPLHDLLPEEGVLALLVQVVAVEDSLEVVGHGAVLLRAERLLLVVGLHLLDESLEQLGVLLGEVRLLLALLLVPDALVEATAGHGGAHDHPWLSNRERSLDSLLHHLFGK